MVQPAAFPAAMGPLEPAISPGTGNKSAWYSTTDAERTAAASEGFWTLKHGLHPEGLDSHLQISLHGCEIASPTRL